MRSKVSCKTRLANDEGRLFLLSTGNGASLRCIKTRAFFLYGVNRITSGHAFLSSSLPRNLRTMCFLWDQAFWLTIGMFNTLLQIYLREIFKAIRMSGVSLMYVFFSIKKATWAFNFNKFLLTKDHSFLINVVQERISVLWEPSGEKCRGTAGFLKMKLRQHLVRGFTCAYLTMTKVQVFNSFDDVSLPSAIFFGFWYSPLKGWSFHFRFLRNNHN